MAAESEEKPANQLDGNNGTDEELISAADEKDSGMGFGAYLRLAGGGLVGLILLVFFAGVTLAVFGTTGPTAARLSMIRDVFIIILALEFILVIIALVILIVQVTRLIVMLQSEFKPILKDTRETVDSARGTASFVGKNVARPVINAQGFMAGAWVFMREIGGIRRAIRRSDGDEGELSKKADVNG